MKQKLPLKREFSAGGVLFRRQDGKVLWLIGKHSGYHKWVLPKGLIEKGEKGIETAVRETQEEMGVVGRVVGEKPVYKAEYWYVAEFQPQRHKASKLQSKKPERRVKTYQEAEEFGEVAEGGKIKVFKTVSFYLLEYVGGDPKDHDFEMSEAGWYGFDEASELLAFEGEREALRKARELVV